MTKADEQALVKRARAGDREAFEIIVRAYEKILYNIALRTLRSPEDAADAVQETFLKAYTALPGFRGDSRLSVWIFRIATNVCTDALRARKETVSLSSEEGGAAELAVPDGRFDPADVIARKDLRERIGAAMALLPPEFRQPLLLCAYGGLSYAQIAETLSLDVNTVRSRIFRARKKLCAILAEDGNFLPKNPSDDKKGGART